MKVCFFLQRRFAYVGHKLAVVLKNEYGISDFCGYVQVRSSYDFLMKQKDIKYSCLMVDEDIHESYKDEKIDFDYLKKLEKEIGIPYLWPYVALDRAIMFNQMTREYPYNTPPYTHEEMIKIFQVKAKAIFKLFDAEKPDVVFLTVIGGLPSLLLYEIAKKRNIKVIIQNETRIGEDGCILTDDYRCFSGANKLFDEYMRSGESSPKIEQARSYIENFRKKSDNYAYRISDYVKNNNRKNNLRWLFSRKFIKSFSWFIKFCIKYAKKGRKADYHETKPIGFLIDRFRRKVRLFVNYSHYYNNVDLNEDYAYYPLHFEPEISVALLAPYWTDQLNLIRQIAQSLPLHFKLYVKEHPHMVGYRTHAYYKELKKIPNVKLINPDFSSMKLIKNAKMVTTISGTAGWEAVLLRKPVITFGDVFYNKLSMVKKSEIIEKLPWLIKEQLENFKYNGKVMENFVGAILEESAPVNLLEIWEKGVDSDIEKRKFTLLADLIAKKLNI